MTASQYLGVGRVGRVGPVARAVEKLAPPEPGARRRTAAEALAALLDLPTSVRLAHCLGASWWDARREDADERAPTLLPDYVRKRLEAIEDAAGRRLGRPFEGARVRVAGPSQLLGELLSAGATKSVEARREFAQETWATYRDFLLGSLQRIRAEIAELRDEIKTDLRHAGRRGESIEAVDTVLRGAMNASILELYERLATAMGAAFVPAFGAAIAELAEPIEQASIEPWFAAEGLLGAQIARTRELTRAHFVREARLMTALVDAAFEEERA